LRTESSARISANYDYLRVTDFYQFHLLNASFGYSVRLDNYTQFNWNHIGVDVLRPPVRRPILNPSKFLELSFDNQLFTGFLLRSFDYNHSSRTNNRGGRWNYRLGFEMSGLEVMAANRLWGAIAGRKSGTDGLPEILRIYQARSGPDLSAQLFRKYHSCSLRAGCGYCQ
jgi:hypothetical protein